MSEKRSCPEDTPASAAAGPVRVRANSIGDLIALVPYLTGYRLTEGVVVLVYQDGRIQLTASVSIAGVEGAEVVVGHVAEVCRRFPEAEFILIGFHPDRDAIVSVLQATQSALAPERVLDVVHTDNQRYWSLTCLDACCPPEGVEVDQHSPAAVQAVLAGAVAEPNRAAIVDRVAGPSPAAQSRDWLTVQTMLESQRGSSCRERATRLESLIAQGLSDPASLSHVDLLEIACLVCDIPTRDGAWLAMTRANADRYLAVWLRVIGAAPDQVAIAVICLAALAAWIGGHGALLTVCVERGEQVSPDYSLLEIVGDIQARAVPPSEWDSWRRDLLQVT